MGADNLSQFSRWRRWREIADLVPIAVVDRPGSTLRALSGRAAQALARWRVSEARGRELRSAPGLVFLHGPRSEMSSTAVRRGSVEVK